MADARAQVLPLVTTGDPDLVEYDFHAIFSNMGVLNYDTTIAAVVRTLGWFGMLAIIVGSFCVRQRRTLTLDRSSDALLLSHLFQKTDKFPKSYRPSWKRA